MSEEMTKETMEVIVTACEKHPTNNEVCISLLILFNQIC